MKVTDRLAGYTLSRRVRVGREAVAKAEREVSTGRRVSLPSDDPNAYAAGLRAHAGARRAGEHKATAARGVEMLDAAAAALERGHELLSRARALAMTQSGPTATAAARSAAALELDGMRAELSRLRATEMHGEPVFVAASGARRVEVGPNVMASSSVDGDSAFAGAVDLDAVLAGLATELRAGQGDAARARVDTLASGLRQLETSIAEAGAQRATMELSGRLADEAAARFEETMNDALAADPVSAMTTFMAREVALRTSLEVGARLMRPVLADKV